MNFLLGFLRERSGGFHIKSKFIVNLFSQFQEICLEMIDFSFRRSASVPEQTKLILKLTVKLQMGSR